MRYISNVWYTVKVLILKSIRGIRMFSTALEIIKKHDKIIIHRHSRPDGDAIGSQVGLLHIIKENFPEKKVKIVGDDVRFLSFIEDSTPDTACDGDFENALSIILDCGAPSLVSDSRYETAAETLRFDHHLFCGKFADFEVIDSSYESCCGLIADFAMKTGLKLDNIAAKALYTGLVTDSGRFRYDATTSNTHRVAAFLMEHEFDTNEIYRNLYSDTYESKKRKAEFLLRVRFTEHNVAYIYSTAEDVAASGLDIFSVSRGMVGTMADIKDVDIWVNFTESDDGVLCELRSSVYNINPIAVKYGGGGHAKASGASVPDRETAMAMLDDLDAMMISDDN